MSNIIKCPAIYTPSQDLVKTSDKYKFVPTTQIIEGFEAQGCVVRQAKQQGKGSSGKHLVRMSIPDVAKIGGSFPEILIRNSHNGTSGLNISLGVYRLVCSNGLVVPEGLIDNLKIRHQGDGVYEAIEETFGRIGQELPKIFEQIQMLNDFKVDEEKVRLYATKALEFSELEVTHRNLNLIIYSRRNEDKDNTAWNLLNKVQENLIKGGFRWDGKERVSKAVKAIDKDLGVNKFLWNEAVTLVKAA